MSSLTTILTMDGVELITDDDASFGAPVIFQHGLCGDSSQTRDAFPSSTKLRRITMECRGHGRSETGPLHALSIEAFANDLASLIERLKIAPVAVGGISMGAAISLRLAVKRPDLVRALILVRPAWVTAPAPANMEPNAEVGRLLSERTPDEARALFMRSDLAAYLSQEAPDNLKSLEGFFGRTPHAVTAALLKQISIDGPGVDEAQVREIELPTLIVGHERDYIHPLSHARTLAGMIPGSLLKVITPKAVSKELYLSDLHHSIKEFLEEL